MRMNTSPPVASAALAPSADVTMPKAGPQAIAASPQTQTRRWLQLNTPITDWQGRRVWLVGASTGIGLACAQALRAAGAQVVVSARNAQGVQDWAAQDAGVQWCALDVGNAAQVQATALALLAEGPATRLCKRRVITAPNAPQPWN
jgi:hypothetical protein